MSEESLERHGGVLAAPVRHPRGRQAAIVVAVHIAAALVVAVLLVTNPDHGTPTLNSDLHRLSP